MRGINLIDLQKQFNRKVRDVGYNLKGKVLVPEVPLSNNGTPKTDKCYITPDALIISPLELIKNYRGIN